MPTSIPVGTAPGSSRSVSLSDILESPRLPSLPAVALQVVEKASHPDCDINELVDLLQKDSGLCARILKTVNSALFGLSRPVTSLKRAVLLLGIRPLRALTLSVSLPAVQTQDSDDLVRKYWEESVTGAIIARQLAVHLRWPEAEDELVAGLLRDLGVLVLREVLPDEYLRLWRSAGRDWVERQCELERDFFGVDHAEISSCLLETWNLPPEIYLPIRHHHQPANLTVAPKRTGDRCRLLAFASRLAVIDEQAPDTVDELLAVAEKDFAMDRDALVGVLESVEPSILEFAAILNVEIRHCPDFGPILARGSEELMRLSTQQAVRTTPSANQPLAANPQATLPPVDATRNLVRSEPAAPPPSVEPAPAAALPEFDVSCLDPAFRGKFRLNDLEVTEVVGRGAMGVVFKAHDHVLNRFVAIKMLSTERMALAEARERFLREARTAAAIRHENVVSIHQVGYVYGLPYIVMEYVRGTSLEELVLTKGALPIPLVIRYAREIANGLRAAHRQEVIHRDVKPANILVDGETGSAKITDFGLARVVHDVRLSQDGSWVGTPSFMAPEQFGGTAVDHRADLFSFGSVLYTLCAGRVPFASQSILPLMKEICTATPTPVSVRCPTIPTWLERMINKLLAKSPAARYQSAAEVIGVINQYAGRQSFSQLRPGDL